MGMFDYIVCRYPLPGKPPAFINEDHQFQTKDFDCYLDLYIISETGKLFIRKFDPDGQYEDEKATDESGKVRFYTSNICAAGPGLYTRDGADAQSVEYEAVFENGQLKSLVETSNTREPAFPSSKMKLYQGVDVSEERIAEKLIGKTVYVLWGGQDEGYLAEVVAEDDKKLCLKTPKGLELIGRTERDHIFWDSEEAAKENKAKRNKHWQDQADEFNAYVEEWNKVNKVGENV